MNLEELLVDICLLLGAPAYINKVCGLLLKDSSYSMSGEKRL